MDRADDGASECSLDTDLDLACLGGRGREEQSELLSTAWDSLNCRLAAITDRALEAVREVELLGLEGRAEEDMSSLLSSCEVPGPPVILMLFLQAVRGEAGARGGLCDLTVPALELSL